MPDIGGNSPKRRSLNLDESTSGGKGKGTPAGKAKAKAGQPAPPPKKRPKEAPPKPARSQVLFDDDEDEDDGEDDEIIQASLSNKKNTIDGKIFAIGGVALVLVIIVIFMLFMGKKDEPEPTPPPQEPTQTEPEPEDPLTPGSTGIQNFLGDTNNTSDSPLSNPEGFVEDINGLTMRVEYEVTAITDQVDFVNYTKKRGTWGGGLELYWLDCTYHETQYVVQVPFKYYKELTETGIVPVKMEVLQVKQPTGEIMYVVSYMSLDEKTLEVFLKSASKK